MKACGYEFKERVLIKKYNCRGFIGEYRLGSSVKPKTLTQKIAFILNVGLMIILSLVFLVWTVASFINGDYTMSVAFAFVTSFLFWITFGVKITKFYRLDGEPI